MTKSLKEKVDKAAKEQEIFEPKYGGKDHSGYDTLMKYEVNDYLSDSFQAGASFMFAELNNSEKKSEPFYRGDGNHSVNELQKMCRDFKEHCYQRQLDYQRLQAENESLKKGHEVLNQALAESTDRETYYLEDVNKKITEQKAWLIQVFKSSEETFRLFDRADLIGNAEAMDKSQEAAHYNWLDDKNDELEATISKLRKGLRAIQDYVDLHDARKRIGDLQYISAIDEKCKTLLAETEINQLTPPNGDLKEIK